MNIKSERYRKPLPVFYVDPKGNNNEIYKLKHISNEVISVEQDRTPKQLPQCFRCQASRYAEAHCKMFFNCVKCGQIMPQSNVRKPDIPSKCIHNDDNRTANYRGCTKYQQLMKKKSKNCPNLVITPKHPRGSNYE